MVIQEVRFDQRAFDVQAGLRLWLPLKQPFADLLHWAGSVPNEGLWNSDFVCVYGFVYLVTDNTHMHTCIIQVIWKHANDWCFIQWCENAICINKLNWLQFMIRFYMIIWLYFYMNDLSQKLNRKIYMNYSSIIKFLLILKIKKYIILMNFATLTLILN